MWIERLQALIAIFSVITLENDGQVVNSIVFFMFFLSLMVCLRNI